MKILNFIFVFIFLLSAISSYAQEHETFEILEQADILDNATSEEFYKIPELKSKNGALGVHLFVHEDTFDFAGDVVKLRNYSYESNGKKDKIPGPFGPTLRINPSDRLTMVIHNDLPTGPDMSYLGSMLDIPKNRTLLNKSGDVSSELKKILIDGAIFRSKNRHGKIIKTNLIVTGNLAGAVLEVVKKDHKWKVYGKEPCKCAAGEEGTCGYIEIIYTIEKMFNPGSQKNALRIYETKEHTEDNHNVPHGFNRTNMHTHGFHISPFQDDILRTVDPSFSSYYTYDLQKHTPGTMWYHPHVHGSTALQVASGMSGVIIIEDGDLSGFPALAEASKPEHERVLLVNQIIYDTIINELPDFNTMARTKPPKGTTINGQVVPKMPIQPGEVQRWRIVHSGYASLLGVFFPKDIEVYQIAVDGIMFKKPRKLTSLHMAPGNRSDILIRVPKGYSKSQPIDILSMTYQPECEYFPNDPNCTKKPGGNPETLMKLVVSGNSMDMKIPNTLPGPGSKHSDITKEELSNPNSPRKTDFQIVKTVKTKKDSLFVVNGKEFEADTIHEILTLGEAEVWKLSSSQGNHPYHIHINPFQVTALETTKGSTTTTRVVDPPIWKDVALVNTKNTVTMRTRYQKYWGDFVLHCHVLSHEDQGMMQRIRIQRPPEKEEGKKEEPKK